MIKNITKKTIILDMFIINVLATVLVRARFPYNIYADVFNLGHESMCKGLYFLLCKLNFLEYFCQ